MSQLGSNFPMFSLCQCRQGSAVGCPLLILFVSSCLSTAVLGCGQANGGASQRIIGGRSSDIMKYPWFVALILTKSKSNSGYDVACGATLVTTKHLLTAAHCYVEVPRRLWTQYYLAGFGLKNRCEKILKMMVPISKVAVHGGYSRMALKNDIALVTLSRDVNYPPACLPNLNTKLIGNAIIIGFGNVRSRGDRSYPCTIQEAQIKVFTRNQCLRTGIAVLMLPLQNTICAGLERGGVDTCDGDSGGPLLRNDASGRYFIQGVTSFGIKCAQPNKPGVYTDVAKYSKWISKNINSKSVRRVIRKQMASLRSENTTEETLEEELLLDSETLLEDTVLEEDTTVEGEYSSDLLVLLNRAEIPF